MPLRPMRERQRASIEYSDTNVDESEVREPGLHHGQGRPMPARNAGNGIRSNTAVITSIEPAT